MSFVGLLFVQNIGTTLTLSGQALNSVAITSQSVSLAGSLVLDISGLDVYDGMTGQWDGVTAVKAS